MSEIREKTELKNFAKFRIEKLFYKIPTAKLNYKTSQLPDHPSSEFILPALTAGIQNQGLNNYVPRKNATILKNVISVSANGANTGVMFFQSQGFTVLQDAYAIDLLTKPEYISREIYLFLVTALQKTIYGNFDWTNKAGWERIKSCKIELPVDNRGEIDYNGMEARIRELELARIRELETYLKVTGLTDYELTADEKSLLAKYRAGEVRSKFFRVGDLFDIQNTFSFNKEKLLPIRENEERFAYITRTSLNNGILGYTSFVNSRNINDKNTFSLGLLQMDFFYQKERWYAGQFVRKIVPKFTINENLAIYFQALLNKLKPDLLAGLVREVDKKFRESQIELPIRENGEPDFTFMENFIRAQQKLAIANVVKWKDREISATKNVVNM